jgi:ring-1,2-phenylacetyl-CoA epoxidase subunit PaaC
LTYTNEIKNAVIQYAIRHGDDRLILGHRISEWCGHGPILEEDLAMTNTALDLIGQTVLWYKYAAELENSGRTEDDIAYLRTEREFYNLLLTEQENDDFAHTMARQFFFDVYDFLFYNELKDSSDSTLSAIAHKSLKETSYHLRHSSEWILRMGDGTEESHRRIKSAINNLWMYTGEMFMSDNLDELLLEHGIAVDLNKIKPLWLENVTKILQEATLQHPDINAFMQYGGRFARHTEYLGYILADMQHIKRMAPEATW